MADQENKENQPPAAEEVPKKEEQSPEAPKKQAQKPRKKRARKEDKEESGEKTAPSDGAAESEEPPKKKQSKKEAKKPMSNLARKKGDERYVQNGKGRYVSKKKSENGKRNVQARAIKCGRQLLCLDGQMVLLGRGKKGEALLDLTRKIRAALKEGLKDEEASEKFKAEAKKMVEEIKAAAEEKA